MSSTRYAEEGSELRPERFASSVEYSGSINAVIAAKRIELIDVPELRDLLWFIQWRSLAPRGLKTLSTELLAHFPERIGTPEMRRMKLQRGRALSRPEVTRIRKEFPFGSQAFLYTGEVSGIDAMLGREASLCKSDDHADSYGSDDLFSVIDNAALNLPEHLVRVCCDPKIDLARNEKCSAYSQDSAGVWYFDNFLGALLEYRRAWIKSAEEKLADTEVSRKVIEELNFCYRERRMILIEGASGVGKSKTARAWCNRSAGAVRYVEVPSSNDERSFYAAIATAIGVAQGWSFNTQEIKLRLEKVIRQSGMMLVLDEAQFAWPQTMSPRGIPAKIQWIQTMFGTGAPIALIGLPTFTLWQERYVLKTMWSGDQLDRRLNCRTLLPCYNSFEDLKAIARAHHPTGDARSWKMLAGLALVLSRKNERDPSKIDRLPNKQASAITETLARASYIAEKAGRERVLYQDIEDAIRMEFPAFDPRKLAADSDSDLDGNRVNAEGPQGHCIRTAKDLRKGGRLPAAGRSPAKTSHSGIAEIVLAKT